MDAFEKVLFYQNENYDHSWFMQFDKKFKGQIPSWFLKWWEKNSPASSEEKNSPASSEASVNRAPIEPFQDAQDPYDGYNLDSD